MKNLLDVLKAKKGEMQAWVVGGMITFLVAAIILYMVSPILYNVQTGVPTMTGSWNTTSGTIATGIQNAAGMLVVILVIIVVVLVVGTIMFLDRRKG